MTTFTTSWVGITRVYNECAPAIYGVVSPAIGATVLVITNLVCVCVGFLQIRNVESSGVIGVNSEEGSTNTDLIFILEFKTTGLCKYNSSQESDFCKGTHVLGATVGTVVVVAHSFVRAGPFLSGLGCGRSG